MRSNFKLNLASRVIALLFFAQWVWFQTSVRNWDRTEVAARFFLGNDFVYFYNAAGHFLSGKSPYLEQSFIPLPSALYLPILLHSLPFWDALLAFRTVCFALAIFATLWLAHQVELNLTNSALALAITLTYGPFYSALAGGNVDALMLALLVFACARTAPVRGAFLGLSIGTKFYSLLLLPVLLLRRRRREILWALAALALALLPFLWYVPEGVSSLLHRTNTLRLEGNESPAVLFILMFGEKNAWLWRGCYFLFWGGTLMVRMAADAREQPETEERFRGLNYLPWMAAAPVLVFTYTGTILLPVIVLMARKNQERELNWAEWLTVTGFLITGIYPLAASGILRTLSQSISAFAPNNPKALLAIAPIGISAMLIGSSANACLTFRKIRSESKVAIAS